MKNLRIKLIVGFRKDQEYSIEAEEAHKAYHLFMNPEKRAIFRNGLGIVGSSIKGIEPDYHGSMGWHPDHRIDSDDWNEIRSRGVDVSLREALGLARDVAVSRPECVSIPLSEVKMLGEGKNP